MTNSVKPITNKAVTNKYQGKDLTALNPMSKFFNFELWAKEVGQQMQAVLQSRSNQTSVKHF